MQGSNPKQDLFNVMKEPFEYGAKSAQDIFKQQRNMPSWAEKTGKAWTAGEDPLQKQAYEQMGGFMGQGGAGQDIMEAGTSAFEQMAGGQTGFDPTQQANLLAGNVATGAGTPYQAMADAFQQQSQRGLQDTMAGIREGMVQAQPGGGSEGNQIQARALAENQQNINSQLAQMYGGAYKQAQDERMPMAQLMAQQQQQALGGYGGMMGTPMGAMGALAQGGAARRGMAGEGLAAQQAAYAQQVAQPQQAMKGYADTLGTLGGVLPNLTGLLG